MRQTHDRRGQHDTNGSHFALPPKPNAALKIRLLASTLLETLYDVTAIATCPFHWIVVIQAMTCFDITHDSRLFLRSLRVADDHTTLTNDL
jgi:hypothetical protein